MLQGGKLLSLQVQTITTTTAALPAGQIILLHGWGANADDLMALSPLLQLPTYQFFFPEAPYPHPQVPGGRMWYDLQTQEGLAHSRQLLREWLTTLAETTGIGLERTILAGFSQGGAMTLDVGLHLPLAGLISFSGYLHFSPTVSENPLPPILLIHGQQDAVVPVQAAHQAKVKLQAIGARVQLQEYAMGHEIQPAALELARQFIKKVVTECKGY